MEKTNKGTISSRQNKLFMDITHDGMGRMCRLYYDCENKRYSLEPLEEESLGLRILREITQKY